MMPQKPEIAVIDANTLACIGLREIIERMMPFAIVRTFNSFEQFTRDTPDMYVHYFISSQVLLEHSAFFVERKAKTIVLTNGTGGTPQASNFHTLNTFQSEQAMTRSLLRLQQSAHAHGRHLPEEAVAQQTPNGQPATDPNGLSPREIGVLILIVQGLTNKEPVHQCHHRHLPPQEHHGKAQRTFRFRADHLCRDERLHRSGPHIGKSRKPVPEAVRFPGTDFSFTSPIVSLSTVHGPTVVRAP